MRLFLSTGSLLVDVVKSEDLVIQYATEPMVKDKEKPNRLAMLQNLETPFYAYLTLCPVGPYVAPGPWYGGGGGGPGGGC